MRHARVTIAAVLAATIGLMFVVAQPRAQARGAPARCAGTLSAGRSPGLVLRAYDVRAVDVRCTTGRLVLRSYLHTVVTQRSESCATAVEATHGRGCLIRGYRCRATARVRLSHGLSIQAQRCVAGRRTLRFVESQRSSS